MDFAFPRVLVADDDEDVRAVIAGVLAADGLAPVQAADGESALSLALIHPPDLAILDILMPGVDGWAVCRRMRDSAFLTDTPIIILTGSKTLEDELCSLACGADAFLTKPATREDLLDAVHRLL